MTDAKIWADIERIANTMDDQHDNVYARKAKKVV